MIMITLSTFLATLVIHLYFRGDRNGAVPPVLRRVNLSLNFLYLFISIFIIVRFKLYNHKSTTNYNKTYSKKNFFLIFY